MENFKTNVLYIVVLHSRCYSGQSHAYLSGVFLLVLYSFLGRRVPKCPKYVVSGPLDPSTMAPWFTGAVLKSLIGACYETTESMCRLRGFGKPQPAGIESPNDITVETYGNWW